MQGEVMLDVMVIDDPAAAEVALDPIRVRLLAALAEPGSASTLGVRVGLSRQKVNYHLRALERVGLVELIEERRKGNVNERWVQASAASYVISSAALADVAPDPAQAPDQLSARWLIALAARLVHEVGRLAGGAAAARQPLATFAVDAELTFANARDRAAFAQELSGGIAQLVEKYHRPEATRGRSHRLVVGLHPSLQPDDTLAGGRRGGAVTGVGTQVAGRPAPIRPAEDSATVNEGDSDE